ncbi:MAG: BA14K family protein [Rhizobiaceae bacterium]|nr:BA14K family protein [Rhizobiaceae bacterium]
MKMNTISVLAFSAMISASPALAQHNTRNIGGNNIGGNNVGVQPQPTPQPCRYNCYGGSREQIIGGVVGGIIGGIIAGSGRRQQQNPQPVQQPVQQPIQPQPGYATPAPQTAGFSQQHYQYCIGKYRSYVIQTNTYTSFSGQTRYCNSPYN